ncbi:hypothetical protein PC129_g20955 [Phytophthora cactorum]|uniref:BZIP domain-containing protein n=2 Tax=Phytophthora cactorum TaxID=29920 RepID=A0A329RFC9_9STRA|nr:hypothetical protein Pcac1_g27165 [Phytophthora cactorum]KAG2800257.1 hypothetical protein PC111_g20045 [Phytophthora cactorum]KAG2800430.1 hypothetical protein PC112_g20484 [Phytophthora cactorum]KAG2881584.1 hypothetical protein PC114_g21487 [Phytophthora cactorum]KAG2898938.1 hypothetical protein PC117_g22408 [Phytophthora cactorum]
MLPDVLHPPNVQSLGQRAIGCVLQRARTPNHSFVPATNTGMNATSNSVVFSCVRKFDVVTEVGPLRVDNQTTQTRNVRARHNRLRVKQSVRTQHDLIEAINLERHRKSQERYRLRQKTLTKNLDDTNRNLRGEIQYLRTLRNKLFIGITTHVTMHDVVTEYFRVFRRGFIEPDGSRVAELDFLRLSMEPDLDAGTVCGFEALVRNWGVFSQLFDDVRFQSEQVDQITENSLVVTTTTSLTISKRSMIGVFLYQGFSGSPAQYKRLMNVVGKVLGRRLTLSGTVRFTWDNSTKRMTGLISQSDIISPLLQLLDDVEDISIMFSSACMTLECNLLEDSFSQYPLYR